jgi:hypothetical protein
MAETKDHVHVKQIIQKSAPADLMKAAAVRILKKPSKCLCISCLSFFNFIRLVLLMLTFIQEFNVIDRDGRIALVLGMHTTTIYPDVFTAKS